LGTDAGGARRVGLLAARPLPKWKAEVDVIFAFEWQINRLVPHVVGDVLQHGIEHRAIARAGDKPEVVAMTGTGIVVTDCRVRVQTFGHLLHFIGRHRQRGQRACPDRVGGEHRADAADASVPEVSCKQAQYRSLGGRVVMPR
jgi:hypothetical protein